MCYTKTSGSLGIEQSAILQGALGDRLLRAFILQQLVINSGAN
jgi:hypothetical protein